jgi:predicted RNA-binding Zn-ribbon protein involved in translation (DUF1610 family)
MGSNEQDASTCLNRSSTTRDMMAFSACESCGFETS